MTESCLVKVCLYYDSCGQHNRSTSDIDSCVVVSLFPLLVTSDPNESAKDMIESYKRECAILKIRPISKLLEQLEVRHMTDHMIHHLACLVFYCCTL